MFDRAPFAHGSKGERRDNTDTGRSDEGPDQTSHCRPDGAGRQQIGDAVSDQSTKEAADEDTDEGQPSGRFGRGRREGSGGDEIFEREDRTVGDRWAVERGGRFGLRLIGSHGGCSLGF